MTYNKTPPPPPSTSPPVIKIGFVTITLANAQETSPEHEFSGDGMRMKKTDRRVCIRLLSDDVGTRTNERE